jgi:hypothetical protein
MWVRLCRKYEIHVLPEKLIHFRVWANEINISGDRPDTRIRMLFELFQIYDNYREIKTPEEFMKVFPIAKKYFKPEGFEINFALGMVALDAKTLNIAKLFGLRLLFEALNDPNRAKKINDLYRFSHIDFIDLTAKHDVFLTETCRNLQIQNQDLQIEASALSAQLRAITQSRAWKFASFLQKIWLRIQAFFSI